LGKYYIVLLLSTRFTMYMTRVGARVDDLIRFLIARS